MRTKLGFLLYLLALLLIAQPSFSKNTASNIYSDERPLVYEGAYNLWPYSFLNDKGEPEGFNIDMLKLIMNELNIPYTIRLKHPNEVLEDIKNQKADLTFEIYSKYNSQFGLFGNSVISLITHSIVSPESQPSTIRTFNDLANHKIIVKENSICHYDMIEAGIEANATPCEDVIEAIMDISNTNSGMVLWNTMSLKYLINKYHLHNLQITPIQMTNDEYRFMSNDTILLSKLDNIYQKLTANEQTQPIRKKWFYPEAMATGIPEYIWYIAAVLIALMLTLVLSIGIYRKKLKNIRKEIQKQNRLTALYMRSGHSMAITYDTERNTFQIYSAEGDIDKELSQDEFAALFKVDDFEKISHAIDKIKKGISETENLIVKRENPKAKESINYFNIDISVLHSNNGTPSVLLATIINITEERNTIMKANDLLKRYQSIFNTTMADMFYFDSNGRLTEINNKACDTLGIKNKEELLKDDIRLEDIILQPVDNEDNSTHWGTNLYDLDCPTESKFIKKYVTRRGYIFYKSRLAHLHDDNGNKICTLITGNDMSDTMLAIKQRKEQARIIRSKTRKVSDYVDNINNAMGVSNIRIVNYYPDTRILTIKHNLNEQRTELSQLRCLELLDSSEHKATIKLLKAMDKRQPDMMTRKVKTRLKDKAGRDLYLQLNFVPILKNDIVDHYFGLCRDISELTETEIRLKEEMEKAQETEQLKNTFLRNMSHDIRTPLNSIVGFAELFNSEHSQEDELVFVEEIKNNTNILLSLINDILFLSRLDANIIDFKQEPADVSTLFKAHCSIGWSKELTNDVETIIDCADNLILNIDGTHFAHIIDILTANAALLCKKGTITARCEHIFDKLNVSIQDTGEGLDEEIQKNLFNRIFDTNNIGHSKTKLGLFICKSLIDKMGGEMHIESQLGVGTNIYFTIPCTKAEIMETTSLLIKE